MTATAQEQLSGITVLDLSTVGPASRCSALLADLGAEVTKIAPPASASRIEPSFHAYSGGRRTKRLRLDLKDEAGRETFLALVRSADVVIESYRPGVADRLGVGFDACRAANPRIVYAALTGYGQDGPYAQWAGHDLNYLALGGLLGLQGRREDGGPAMPGATVADSAGGGFHAALAITAALVARGPTGQGQYLDVAATDGVLSLMSLQIDEYLATGSEPRAGETLLTGRYACYDVYPARDGKWLAVGAIEQVFFANLCRALGCEELAPHQYDDDRQEEIRAALRAAFATADRDEWVTRLAPADTCVAPVLTIAEVITDRYVTERGLLAELEHPAQGRVRQLGPVVTGARRGPGPFPAAQEVST